MKNILNIMCSHRTNRIIVKIYFILTVIQLAKEVLFGVAYGISHDWFSKNLPFLMSSPHREQSPNFLITHPFVLPAIIVFFLAGIAGFIYENNYNTKTVSYTILTVTADMILAVPVLFVIYIYLRSLL
ncbi:MAG: hypothetical protein K2N49_03345 [Ruminococcus sp.]|nr:hypothetical protein [Ruminococcus sp.]MDE7225880.1 hypothetical protein [Ruminococcus sp.]